MILPLVIRIAPRSRLSRPTMKLTCRPALQRMLHSKTTHKNETGLESGGDRAVRCSEGWAAIPSVWKMP